MRDHFTEVANRHRAGVNRNRVKSQLVESHLSGADGRDGVIHRLNQLIEGTGDATDAGWLRLEETDDEHLLVLRARADGDESVRLFVDTQDPRYWIVHSLDKSQFVRHRMEGLAAQLGRGFDNVWFSNSMLDAAHRFGRRRGVKVQFTDYMAAVPSRDDADGESLRITLKSVQADRLLRFLRDGTESPFASKVGLSASLIRAEDPEETASRSFVLEDIYYNGHFTARGTSARRHLEVVTGMRDAYRLFISRLEEQDAISFEADAPSGNVLGIAFTRQDLDMTRLVERLSSGKPPFNFWAIPVALRESHVRLDLVDLHHGNAGRTLTVEVMRSGMRVWLPKGVCGNAVARLLSNIQRGIDSSAYLVSADEVIA